MANEDPNAAPTLPSPQGETWRTAYEAALRVLAYHNTIAAQRRAQAEDTAEPSHAS